MQAWLGSAATPSWPLSWTATCVMPFRLGLGPASKLAVGIITDSQMPEGMSGMLSSDSSRDGNDIKKGTLRPPAVLPEMRNNQGARV